MNSVRFRKTVILPGLLLLISGCTLPIPGLDNKKEEPPRQFLSVDKGDSAAIAAGGRVVLASWNAGPLRNELVTCWEPPPALGLHALRRFEHCVDYLNGIITRYAYQGRLAEERKAELTGKIPEISTSAKAANVQKLE